MMRRILSLGMALLGASASIVGAHPGVFHEIDRLSAALAESPADATLYVERAYFLRVAGSPERSLADLDAARRLDPSSPRIAAERGLTLSALRRDAEAARELDVFLRAGEGTAATWTERARVRARLGRTSEAGADYRKALRLHPDAELYLECGALLESIPDLEAAAAVYREGLERAGAAVTIRSALVRVEIARGRPDEAARLLDDEVAAAAFKTESLLRRAAALEAAGRPADARADRERALAESERAVAKSPTAIHLLSRAKARAAVGRVGEAEQDLMLALTKSPHFEPASELLARLRGNDREARTQP